MSPDCLEDEEFLRNSLKTIQQCKNRCKVNSIPKLFDFKKGNFCHYSIIVFFYCPPPQGSNGWLFICVAFLYRIAFSFIVIVAVFHSCSLSSFYFCIHSIPRHSSVYIQNVSRFRRRGKRGMLFIGKHPPLLFHPLFALLVFVCFRISQYPTILLLLLFFGNEYLGHLERIPVRSCLL